VPLLPLDPLDPLDPLEPVEPVDPLELLVLFEPVVVPLVPELLEAELVVAPFEPEETVEVEALLELVDPAGGLLLPQPTSAAEAATTHIAQPLRNQLRKELPFQTCMLPPSPGSASTGLQQRHTWRQLTANTRQSFSQTPLVDELGAVPNCLIRRLVELSKFRMTV
jgi:hypothetical protein